MTAATPTFRELIRASLLRDEGLKLQVYTDPVGRLAIGVGYDLDAHGLSRGEIADLKRTGVTKQQALDWLEADIDAAEADCVRLFGQAAWTGWSDIRRAGFTNWLFNLGYRRASTFRRTLAAVAAGDWVRVRAGLENSLWSKQVKTRSERVIAAVCEERWGW